MPPMAREAADGLWSRARALAPGLSRGLLPQACWQSVPARWSVVGRRPVRRTPSGARASFSAGGGFARLVIKLGEDVPSEVTTAGSILIIRFDRPVDVPVDRVPEGAPDYVTPHAVTPTAARYACRWRAADRQHHECRRAYLRRPHAGGLEGTAAEPTAWTWSRNSPTARARPNARCARSVPRRRARSVRRSACVRRYSRPSCASCSRCPTASAFSVLNEQKLTLAFNANLNFDLADAVVAAPPNVASIKQKTDIDQSSVEHLR